MTREELGEWGSFFGWTLVVLACCATAVVFMGAGLSLLYELFHFLRYGNWPQAVDSLVLIASHYGAGNDVLQWVTGLEWVGLRWLLLHWPLSAVGAGTGLLMFFVLFVIAAWTED